MNEQTQLKDFADRLIQEVISISDSEENGGEFRTNEFTRIALEYLMDAEEIDDFTVCYHKSRGMQINGYNVSQDENCLDLFVTIFNQQSPPVSITKTQAEIAFAQAEGVLKKALAGYYTSLEESSEVYDMFQRFYELRDELTRVRIYLLADGIVNAEDIISKNIADISITFHVWDIRRIFRFANSGKKFETIVIDFEGEFGATIPCLPIVDLDTDYQGYIAVLPGEILAAVYDKYGPRLLERNVRSFLQARGNVNKGIRKTIIEEPHRFFAYNNGISATADEIQFINNAQKQPCICKVQNLQIVNGGQTTASLYHTAKKDKASLKGIYVQAKFSVIPPAQINDIVPFISRYANSQNKVSHADFFANDPFHIRIEELSRTIWAPASDGTNKQTKWFYERARGQYLDAKNREFTAARKRQFEMINPNSQRITKTDLAKYENTWMQLPHLVSLGAQKNFNHFSIRLKEHGRLEVDSQYFEHLIAKSILFKRAEKIIGDMNYGGYRANTVTYTLAWLSHHTSQRIDLDLIWRKQNISPTLQEAIRTVSKDVRRVIIDSPNAGNITEWCKRKECWGKVSTLDISIGDSLEKELIDLSYKATRKPDKGIDKPDAHVLQMITTAISKNPAQTWFNIAKWAKETNNLQSWQRSLSFSIGKALLRGYQVSRKQTEYGRKILEEVRSLGFNLDE